MNQTYVHLAQHLDDDDRLRLAAGELKLAQVHRDYRQRLAERRAQREQASCEAQEQAERELHLWWRIRRQAAEREEQVQGPSLAEHLRTASPAERVEAARALGVDRVWDEMVLPLVGAAAE